MEILTTVLYTIISIVVTAVYPWASDGCGEVFNGCTRSVLIRVRTIRITPPQQLHANVDLAIGW